MVNLSIGSVATSVQRHIQDIPSDVSGNVIHFTDEARIFFENFTNLSIGSTAFDQKYNNVLVNLTAAKVAGVMTGIGFDYNWALGEFNVNKGTGDSPLITQMENFVKNAQFEMRLFGKRIGFFKVLG